ncbi:MAG TPA: class I SAM-dependent methyltransferase [Vicinamibacterales bacterium]|jgi:arsenite methyltransferase|nr:class I SAM-dependent methyltransferase [Vicinamibacterales bacterium]
MRNRGSYGYDAPYALASFASGGSACLIAALFFWWTGHARRPTLELAAYGVFFLANAASFLYTTRIGKFQVWGEILDGLRLRGDERVLDLGCGRGAVLTAVARRLTSGRVTGVDVWSTRDQSGNSRDVTLANAASEGVRERVEVATGDMRALPFEDAMFDLVVSSLAIHNIHGNEGRGRAVSEAWRVLKPGGRLVIADIRATAFYARTLEGLRAASLERRGLGWRFWYGNPFASTSLVVASKPAHWAVA